MTEDKTTITDNEVIARFMDLDIDGQNVTDGEQETTLDKLQYSTSWSWLMPVVEKIESIEGMYVRIQKDRCVMFDSGFGEADILVREQRQPNQYPASSINQPSKIEAVYKAVIEFIRWHNTQSKP